MAELLRCGRGRVDQMSEHDISHAESDCRKVSGSIAKILDERIIAAAASERPQVLRSVKDFKDDAGIIVEARRKAEEGNEAHVAAPMPGAVSTIAVQKGQAIKAGDVLLTIEAMKMETALHAPRDCVVAELLVTPGMQIDAKDLLVVLS